MIKMKSMLILSDFSEAAFRAAEYACGLTSPLQINKIVLYHAYETMVPGTDVPVYIPQGEQQIYMESMEALGLLHDRIKSMVDDSTQIDLLAEDTTLSDRINSLCSEKGIDFIVMGVSGKSGLEKLLGSTAIEILKISDLPVLVVPNEALIGRGIKTIVFTTDLKESSTVPVNQLNTFLEAFKADIHVANVKSSEAAEKYTPEMEASIAVLHDIMDKYHASFHYITGDNIVDEILNFADQNKASLIITVPKKHSFFSALFHKSISKKLAYNSRVPLLCLPGLD
jgi:nucleotide-binding universal stress UspA family protein